MNKDEVLCHLRKNQRNCTTAELIRGLEDRNFGHTRKYAETKENIEIFAEEQLVKKKQFNEMRCEMPHIPRSTFLMVFSPDGSRVASTHGNHNIYVTDIRTGKNIKTLEGHPRTPWCIAFHPTSDQIVASGCLGGQVRIWDLSGGSEVWSAGTQSVIASIAFHPNDRVLVIATYNEVYFWDWSQPEPFVVTATSNPKEKVRYVAFDSLGHTLITGIANSPQTKWEKVRTPVTPPRTESNNANSYRRRITQRIINMNSPPHQPSTSDSNRELQSPSIPERERRITTSYRNLVREYEQLVQRYLQLYKPPIMVDRGTDPMVSNPLFNSSGTQTSQLAANTSRMDNSVANLSITEHNCNVPSVGNNQNLLSSSNSSSISLPTESRMNSSRSNDLITPSKIFPLTKKIDTLIRGTQTSESRKHKADDNPKDYSKGKKIKKSSSKDTNNDISNNPGTSSTNIQSTIKTASSNNYSKDSTASTSQVEEHSLQTQHLEHSTTKNLQKVKSNSNDNLPLPNTCQINQPNCSNFRCKRKRKMDANLTRLSSPERQRWMSSTINRTVSNQSENSTNICQNSIDELLSNIRRTAEEEVRSRILPIIRSVPVNDRPELIRLFESSREHIRLRLRQMFLRQLNRRSLNLLYTTSDSSNSDDDDESNTSTRCISNMSSTTDRSTLCNSESTSVNNNNSSNSQASTSNSGNRVRNFNMELEELITTLLAEIERNEAERSNSESSNMLQGSSTTTVNITTSTTVSTSSCHMIVTEGSSTSNVSNCNFSSNIQPSSSSSIQSHVSQPDFTSSTSTGHRHLNNFVQNCQNDVRESLSDHFPISFTTTPITAATIVNTNTRTTNSTIYTSNTIPRRRFFSHRISAFMPTRVNLSQSSRIRQSLWGKNVSNLQMNGTSSLSQNTSAECTDRINSEDTLPQRENSSPLDLRNTPSNTSNALHIENNSTNNANNNLLQNVESNMNDIRNIPTNDIPSETSTILNNFSERLVNVMNQYDSLLGNLTNSIEMFSDISEHTQDRPAVSESGRNLLNQNLHVRDQSTDDTHVTNLQSTNNNMVNISDLLNSRSSLNVIASDHSYPRNSNSGQRISDDVNVSSIISSLHRSISHIQRQARLLRQQLENVERIDRTMQEVAQLQLVRQIIKELVRVISGENRNIGISNVRQMMAGTRINDSSSNEDSNSPSGNSASQNTQQHNSNSVSENVQLSNSNLRDQTTREQNNNVTQIRHRGIAKKTYPTTRIFRLARQCHRLSMRHVFYRRYLNRGGRRLMHNSQFLTATNQSSENSFNTLRNQPNSSVINSSTLSFMTRRLEDLLTSQMRVFTRPEEVPQNNRSTSTVDLGEYLLTLRLHGCVLRMNRVLGNNAESTTLGNIRSTSTSVVMQEGVTRYGARHTLSVIVDGLSRHIEELGSSNIAPSVRYQIHGVLAMSLLLTELLLLFVVDSIPSISAMNLNSERESLATRIDQMCGQILRNQFNRHSHQFTRSLRVLRLTMRHAYRVLGRNYRVLGQNSNLTRNLNLTRPDTNRTELISSINQCLRSIGRSEPVTNSDDGTAEGDSSLNSSEISNSNINISQITASSSGTTESVVQNPTNNLDTNTTQGSMSIRSSIPHDVIFSNNSNNSINNEESTAAVESTAAEESSRNNNSNSSNNLYRNNNNLPSSTEFSSQRRLWNVPSVQVNDIPVSEPSVFAQRLISQRQRFAERVSELRSNPSIGLFRPRFLHPLYSSINPFDSDLDDPQREQIYDSDMIATVTPNHRIQAWDISNWNIPAISNSLQNIVVSECKIHNDASVDVAKDGTILVTLLPSGGYINVTNRLGVYSLKWETLGQCLYTTSFEQNAVSVSLSPLSRHLIVGLASRRVTIVPSEKWIMARIFKIIQKDVPGDRLPVVRELEQNRDSRINCIRWLPVSGQGLIYATNTGHLVVLS